MARRSSADSVSAKWKSGRWKPTAQRTSCRNCLTAKSDDVYGRAKIYEAIVKGEPGIEPGVPESFNVLVRELQSLCLDVELMKRQKPAEKAAD